MSSGIPLPGFGGEALQRGVEHGINTYMQQKQHAKSSALREQEIARLMQLLPHQINEYQQKSEYHPFKMQETKQNIEKGPQELALLEAKVKTEQEKAESLKKGGNQRITAAIQEADVLYDRDDPRHTQYILNKSKQVMPNENQVREDEKLRSSPEFEKIAPYLENAVDMNPLSPAVQNMHRKEMKEELAQIDKAKQVKHAIGQAREITKSNPDLYRKAINIIANPDATPGWIEKSLTAIMPKKDVETFTQAAKLYADILTKQAQLNGMSRSVYALRLQQQAKAQVKNPDETNEQIFRNILREIEPSIDREKALLYGMKHNKYIPLTKNYDMNEGATNQVPSEVYSPTGMGMKAGIINGEQVEVEPDDEQAFIEAGGRIL